MTHDLTDRERKEKAIEAAEEYQHITVVAGSPEDVWDDIAFKYNPHITEHNGDFLQKMLQLRLAPHTIFSNSVYFRPFDKETKEVQVTKTTEVYEFE